MWWIVVLVSLPVLMNYGWPSYVILLLGYFVITVIAGFVSSMAFPLDVARYESDVTGINLTK
jgi:hypothetical protein